MFRFFVPLFLMVDGSAFAAYSDSKIEAAGSQVILRQVLSKKLLGSDAEKAFRAALKPHVDSELSASIKSADCHGNGSQYTCDLWLEVFDQNRPDGFKDISFGVKATASHGDIVKAHPYCTEEDSTLGCED